MKEKSLRMEDEEEEKIGEHLAGLEPFTFSSLDHEVCSLSSVLQLVS